MNLPWWELVTRADGVRIEAIFYNKLTDFILYVGDSRMLFTTEDKLRTAYNKAIQKGPIKC